MLKGRFGDTSGRPFIEAKLYIPSFSVEVRISFLVDTGADTTSLLPADSAIIGLELDKLPLARGGCVGIGGEIACREVEAVVLFTDDTYLYSYIVTLSVIPPCVGLDNTPSLLGRDVIDNWAMTYDPSKGRLEFVVRKWDLRMPIDP